MPSSLDVSDLHGAGITQQGPGIFLFDEISRLGHGIARRRTDQNSRMDIAALPPPRGIHSRHPLEDPHVWAEAGEIADRFAASMGHLKDLEDKVPMESDRGPRAFGNGRICPAKPKAENESSRRDSEPRPFLQAF